MITIQLDEDIEKRLSELAARTLRSKSLLAADAIREYVETADWKISEVKAALDEADRGDFANDDDVARLAEKWQVNAG